MKEMRAVLARQREVLTSLLVEAAISPADAEPLLLDVLLEIEEQGAPLADFELLWRVDAACAAHAARRKRPYQGLRRRASSPLLSSRRSSISKKRSRRG